MKKLNRTKGFTLVELLTVIAIIGILAAILIPAVEGMRTSAAKQATASNGRQIGLAYQNFSQSGSRVRHISEGSYNKDNASTSASTSQEVGVVLAAKAGLNAAELWYRTNNAQAPDVDFVLSNADGTPNSEFTGEPVDWEAAVGFTGSEDGSTTPFLATFGAWNVATSGYATDADIAWDDGVHVVYLDSHVVFIEQGAEEPFVTQTAGAFGNTDTLDQALPDGAEVLPAE